MNPWLLAAGAAALVLDLVHIFPGGREIFPGGREILPGGRELHRPMVASHWPEPAKAVWSVLWHAATSIMAVGGLALIAAAFLPDHALALAIVPVTLFLSAAALFLYYGLRRLGSVTVLPHWLAFSAISLLALIGLAT